jgi:opacity protein-like surface antigen
LSDKIKQHNYMKKLILAIFAVGVAASAQAQSGLLLYGMGGYQTVNSTYNTGIAGQPEIESKNRGWQLMPGIGYQLNNRFAVGLNVGIQGNKTINEDLTNPTTPVKTENINRNFQIGPFVRMIMPLGNTFFVFNQLNISYLSGRTIIGSNTATPTPSTDTEHEYNGFGALWYPAVGINVTHCMALTFEFGGIGYARQNWDNDGPSETTNSGFGVTLGRGFSFGVQAVLGGRKNKGYIEPGVDRRMDTSDDEEEMPRRRSSDDE